MNVVIIAARMGSSRFPGKSLADINGKTMLSFLLDRIIKSKVIDKVVLATTNLKEDDVLEKWSVENDVMCYRGSSNDVLGRIYNAAVWVKATKIIEILGDNPLVDSELIDSCYSKTLENKNKIDYAATITTEYPLENSNLKKFPIGVRVQVMTIDALELLNKLAKSSFNREHSTSLIYENPKLLRTNFLCADNHFLNCNRPDLTFAVNHQKNIELIRSIDKALKSKRNYKLKDVIEFIDNNPHLKELMG